MEFFGLDIGSYSLKAVQLRKEKEEYELVAFNSAPSTAKWIESEAEGDLISLAETIKKLHQEAGISTKNVATALPEDKVFTRVVTLPSMTEEELSSAIKWEAEQYVPIPLKEVELAYQIVGRSVSDQEKKMEVLIAAAPKRLIEKVLKILKAAGLNPVALETEIMAMVRSLVPEESKMVLVVDLGARATDLAVVEKGQIIFTRSIPTAGEALTRAVASELDLDLNQAEAYKKAYGVDPKKLEGKIQKAINPILSVIVQEMEKVIEFFQTDHRKTIKQVILTGGTTGLPEVVSWMTKRLSLEVQVGDPFARIKINKELKARLPTEDVPLYATAVGLALKEL